MPVRVRCANPACAKTSSVPDELSSRQVRCPACRTPMAADTRPAGDSQTSPPAGARAAAPERVGRFEVRARLGAGAFGTVYRALDPQLGREVAVKVPNPGALDSPGRVDRFLREARAAAGLRHPHIVPVYDAGRDGDRYYIAAAFVDGRPLADVAADGGLDFARAARLARELAEALAYAHGQGVVHRDVKPANCLLDAHDRLHLMDFGLAFRQDEASRLTTDGQVMGTPAYMAPEQAAGRTADVGPAADQYACGVVLYELLAGRVPFGGPVPVVLHNQVHTDPDPPSKLRNDVPKDLETICLKAMAKRPADRYPGCQALADDLRRWLDGEPIAARRLGAAERAVRWVRRNPAVASLTAGVFAALLVGISASLLMAAKADAEANRAEANAREAGDQRIKAEAKRAEAEAVAAKLLAEQARVRHQEYIADVRLAQNAWDESRVARMQQLLSRHAPVPGGPDLRGPEWHLLNRFPWIAAQAVGISAHRTTVALTRDGRLAAWPGVGGRVTLHDCDRALTSTLPPFSGVPIMGLGFSAAGNHLAGLTSAGEVVVWTIRDATTPRLLSTVSVEPRGPNSINNWVTFSPDDRRLVVSAFRNKVTVLGFPGGEQVHVVDRLPYVGRRSEFSPDGTRLVVATGPTLQVVDLVGRKDILRIPARLDNKFGHAVYLPGGKEVVAGTENGNVVVHDANSGNLLRSFRAHLSQPELFLDPTGQRLMTAATDGTVKCWDVRTGELLTTYRSPTGMNGSTAANAALTRAVSIGHGQGVYLWQFPPAYPFRTLEGDPPVVTALTSPVPRRVYGVVGDTVRAWELPSGRLVKTVRVGPGVTGLAVSRDESKVWIASPTGVKVLNADGETRAASGRELGLEVGPGTPFDGLALSPDGRLIAVREKTGVSVRDAEGLNVIRRFDWSGHTPFGVQYSPSGREVLVRHDQSIAIWDVDAGRRRIELGIPPMAGLACPPAGDWVAVGGWDGLLRVFDTATGTVRADLTGHTAHVQRVMVTSDGSRLISFSADKSVVIWDTSTWQEVLTVRDAHRGVFHGSHLEAALALDGTAFVTSGGGKTYLWDCSPRPAQP